MTGWLVIVALVLLVALTVKVWQIAEYLALPCAQFYWGCI